MRVAVLDDYQDAVRGLTCFAALQRHDVVVHDDGVDGDALVARLAGIEAVVLIRERTRIDAALLARLPDLRLIAQTGRGTAHIDVRACTAHGVVVCAGGGSPVATAELTIGLVLASLRHIPAEAARLRTGGWQSTIGAELAGKTFGVVGYGRIGARVARYARAFEAEVLAWGRSASLARARADGVEPVADLGEVLERSDVASLHLRLDDGTRGLLTPALLARMRPTALLVNTARAGLIEPGALADALARGRPAAAAVDVFDEEPAVAGREPLLALDNALCTPHLGYVTRESYEEYFGRAFAAVNAFAEGVPVDVVNPEALAR